MKKIIMISMFALVMPLGAAFADDPGGGGLGDPDPQGAQVPIDGGITLLLAAGAGLGARQVWLQRKRKQKNDSKEM